MFKNIVFYGVSGPSVSKNFMLALSKNHVFYVVLEFRGGPEWKNYLLKVFWHGSANFVNMMGQHGAKIGPT